MPKSERFVLLTTEPYTITPWAEPDLAAKETIRMSAADVADALRMGLTILATGKVNGEEHPDAEEFAVAYLKRAAPGIHWAASGVLE